MGATGITAGGVTERKRVEAVIETVAAIHHHGDNLSELAHDARNMVTALSLYCDLLEEPGILAPAHHHYASELRVLAEASLTLVEKLAILDRKETVGRGAVGSQARRSLSGAGESACVSRSTRVAFPSEGSVTDLCAEVLTVRDLLAAIAGPSIDLVVKAEGGGFPVGMTSEDLIRVLVNLVKNSAESINGPGAIELTLSEGFRCDGAVRWLVLSLEDSGRGILPGHLEKVFEPGFTTHGDAHSNHRWPSRHSGLGLSISRSIVEAAGGRIHAENRMPCGARFVIELPVRNPQAAARGPRQAAR